MKTFLDERPHTLPTKEDCVFECIQYVLEHEREDFWENPDRYHIYFYAMSHTHGNDYALATLKEAIKGINK